MSKYLFILAVYPCNSSTKGGNTTRNYFYFMKQEEIIEQIWRLSPTYKSRLATEIIHVRSSLVVQWLGFWAITAEGWGSTTGELKSQKPNGMAIKEKKEIKKNNIHNLHKLKSVCLDLGFSDSSEQRHKKWCIHLLKIISTPSVCQMPVIKTNDLGLKQVCVEGEIAPLQSNQNWKLFPLIFYSKLFI